MVRIECTTSQLAAATTSLKRLLDGKPNIQILGAILIDADARGLRLTATNLHQSSTIACEATVRDGPGALALPGKPLADLLARIDTETVVIELAAGGATIKAGRSLFKLAGLPAIDFPSTLRANQDTVCEFSLDAADVRRLFGVNFAASTEETYYYLRGVALQQTEERLVAVGTNGHMLANTSIALPIGVKMPKGGIIVPLAAAKEVLKHAKLDASLTLRIDDKIIETRVSTTCLASKQIDGTFPAWRRIIPEPSGCTAKCNRTDLLAVVDRLAVITEGRKPAVALQWGDGDGEIKISLGNLGVDVVEATTTGQAHVGAGTAYLRTLLEAVDSDQVTIDSADATLPIRITTMGDPEFLVVLMPCRLFEVMS